MLKLCGFHVSTYYNNVRELIADRKAAQEAMAAARAKK